MAKKPQGIGGFGRRHLGLPPAVPTRGFSPAAPPEQYKGGAPIFKGAPTKLIPPKPAPTPPRNRRKGTFGSELPTQTYDGVDWVTPSPTAWPDVLPDGHAGRPPGPRTSTVGFRPDPDNPGTGQILTIFRDGTPWHYDGVTVHEWNALRRSPSTGRYINRILNGKPYGRGF